MSNFSYTPSAALLIAGVTPAAGPTLTDKVSASYQPAPGTSDDRINETYTINASTTVTALDLGLMTSLSALWIQTDGPLHLTLTQDFGSGPVTNLLRVERFVLLDSTVLALSVANPSATTAVHFSVIAPGLRPAVGGGPGIF